MFLSSQHREYWCMLEFSLKYGRIFNPQDENSKAVAAFNEEVNGDDRTEKFFLTLRDGLYLVQPVWADTPRLLIDDQIPTAWP